MEDDSKEERRPESVLTAYRDRLKVLKQARDYSSRGDIPKSVERYSTYLNTLATYFKTTEDKLSPALFDAEKEISELLLISHAYWDLSKAYDRSPNLHKEAVRCLDQFVKFSIGFKFQHINAQMLKKFIKRKQAHNIKAFSKAHQKIQVESKGCFIATYSFGTEHQVTNDLRDFKSILVKSKIGIRLVEFYYSTSPSVVNLFEKAGATGKYINLLFLKPFLYCFSKMVKLIK
ncbi:hypothetical protein A9Q84_20590 [Halobacteriovorax marinus]|uniref:Uncharacterized protein n=1 Tax=Halobacteriovorax marinus TaxID=97084 RepID=A0A1Y5F723_9BACT|nr:hypothetical protein A9Q84_20590 [Halobacteriovorax marinus]